MRYQWMKMNLREKILIIFLVCALIVGSYFAVRVKAMRLETEHINRTLSETSKKRGETRIIKAESLDTEKTNKEIDNYKQEVSRLENAINNFNSRFINPDTGSSFASAQAEITRLADINRLKVLQIKKSSQDTTSLAAGIINQKNNDLKRPMFDLKLRGDFFGLNQFIEQIGTLPFQAVIVKLRVKANKEQQNGAQNQSLDIDFTISL